MMATYEAATSYTDRGVTTSSSGNSSFETVYVRPNKLRFEYRDNGDPQRAHVVWSDGNRTLSQSYLTPGIVDDGRRLIIAIAVASDVTAGTAYAIPSLLLPHVLPAMTERVDFKLEGSETVDGHRCWHVTGHGLRDSRYALWIDRDSHLLRRVVRQVHARTPGRPDVEVTMSYDPRVNTAIAPDLLRPLAVAGVTPTPRHVESWIGAGFDGTTTTIVRVIHGAPAERAGLTIGDQVVSLDGRPVATATEIIERIRSSPPGTSIAVVVLRAGNRLTITLTPETRPDMDEMIHEALVGKPAPSFAAELVRGSYSAKLADLGGHVVIVDFWATWCRPCALTMPRLDALQAKYGARGLRIVGLSSEDTDDIKQFLVDHKVGYTIARDIDARTAQDYLLQALPMLVIIDKAGIVREVRIGADDIDGLEAAIVRLL
jgi:cytochrome c biogenesis protein CcmG/thiol:disulfide interchange protein DsbE